MTEKTPELRLDWKRTWPDVGDDYWGDDVASGASCRIYLYFGAGKPKWRWMANADRAVAAGYASSAKEAALDAERALWAYLERR